MSDKIVPYHEKIICDICGREGAFDFYGDFICLECLHPNPYEEELEND